MSGISSILISLRLLALLQALAASNATEIGIPEKFCEMKFGCCNAREDDCAILNGDTLCYCDEHCDRSESGDCCPDYVSYCNRSTVLKCTTHSGQQFSHIDGPIRDNCNVCRCDINGNLHCGTDLCLLDDNLIQNIGQAFGWKAHKYTQFWGRKFKDGMRLRLGTFKPKNQKKLRSQAVQLPTYFNAIEHWGANIISPVRDQGWCGSSWAISTASVASDRFSVQSRGDEAVVLSSQQMLSCMTRKKRCNGGHLDKAWNYIRTVGLVDEKCLPNIIGTKCTVPNRNDTTLSSLNCKKPMTKRKFLYKMAPVYALRGEKDIMNEIYNNGPVQATMRVYRDFFAYKNGIYQHTSASKSSKTRFHSVRLVGWGETTVGHKFTKYWIAANSWGTWWGDKGYFRIVRGQNECEIENYVLTSRANVITSHDTRHQHQ